MRPLSSSDIVSRNRCPAPTSTAAPCTPSVCSDSTTHGPCARSCPIITSHWAAGTASRKVGESRVLRSLSTGSEFIWPTIQASCFSIGLVPNVAVTVGVTAGALAVPDAVPVAVPDEEGVVALVALPKPAGSPEQAESVRARATPTAVARAGVARAEVARAGRAARIRLP